MGRPRSQPEGRRIFVPVDSFVANFDGAEVTFIKNVTRVREGHEVLDLYPTMFAPARAHYEVDVEQATAAPGELRA